MLTRCVPILSVEQLDKLKNSHVCVFGVGGVGGFVCEAIARIGVSKMTISRWESGEIKHMKSDKIEKLAIALNVPVMAFFEDWDFQGNKIEREHITPRKFEYEVKELLDKTINLSEQEKNMLLQTLEFICSEKE